MCTSISLQSNSNPFLSTSPNPDEIPLTSLTLNETYKKPSRKKQIVRYLTWKNSIGVLSILVGLLILTLYLIKLVNEGEGHHTEIDKTNSALEKILTGLILIQPTSSDSDTVLVRVKNNTVNGNKTERNLRGSN